MTSLAGRSRRVAGVLWLALVLPLLAGCQSWRHSTVLPQALIAQEGPARVRITLDDSSVLTITSPTVVADTIVGSTLSGDVRAALERVRGVEVRRWSAPRSAAFVIVHVATVVTVAALIVHLQPHYRGF